MNKICPKCNKLLSIDNFYSSPNRKDGVRSYCKSCEKIINASKRDYMREYMRKVYRSDPTKLEKARIYSQKYRLENKDKPKNIESADRAYKRRRLLHKDRMNAGQLLRYHVRVGNILKQPCSICGSLEVQAHHPDYSKPLEVIWLCKKHHMELHRKVRIRNN